MTHLVFHHPIQLFRGTGATERFAAAPGHCPVCGQRIEPRPLVAHSTSPDDLLVDFAFQCPQVNCRRIFVAEYAREAGITYDLVAAAAAAFDHRAFVGIG